MSQLAVCESCPTNWLPLYESGASTEAGQLTRAYRQDIQQAAASAEYGPHKKLIRATHEVIPVFNECQTENWDGYGAQPISELACLNAIKLYTQLPSQYPEPDITPEPDGAIGFEWYLGPYRTLSFSVRGDGKVLYAALFGINDSEYGEKPLGEKLHPGLLKLLDNLYRR